MIINLPIEQRPQAPVPQTEIAELREMFREIKQRYLVDDAAPLYLNAKRIMYFTVSLIFIICFLSWLYPIVALLIKLTSRGPVLFIQKRTGHLGLEFDCFKFRTMYVNEHADVRQASARDKRITPVGRFLRVTHLDETPQLF